MLNEEKYAVALHSFNAIGQWLMNIITWADYLSLEGFFRDEYHQFYTVEFDVLADMVILECWRLIK